MKIFRNPRDDWLARLHLELDNKSYHFIQKEDMSILTYPLFYYSSNHRCHEPPGRVHVCIKIYCLNVKNQIRI